MYFRLRDSLLFEPLLALAIIVVLVVGAYAYTHNWPPVYIVESNSMQHGPDDVLGIINTGDIVFAQQVPVTSIVTYVDALHSGTSQSGFSTYGELGDVVLYHPNGGAGTPIVHRALLYLEWNSTDQSFSAPSLAGLPCGSAPGAVYSYGPPGGPDDCQWSHMTGDLHLYHIGWKSANVTLSLTSPTVGTQSGFLTMGDDNCDTSTGRCYSCTSAAPCIGEPDQGPIGLSSLVRPAWVIGVARGMIPWFGSLKLLLTGSSAEVPSQSFEYMGLTLIGIVLAALAIHLGVKALGSSEGRSGLRGSPEAADEAAEEEEEAPAPRRARSSRSARRAEDEETESGGDDEEDDEVDPPRVTRLARAAVRPPAKRRARSDPKPESPTRRGRPRPSVQRRPPATDEDSEL
ncbi:MAG: S26 family signal peptidase [Thermoplasmata archaeon]